MTGRAPQAPSVDALIIGRFDWRLELATDYEATASRLSRAYESSAVRLRESVGELNAALASRFAAEGEITVSDLRGMRTYTRLLARTEAEMADFAVVLRNEAGVLADRAIVTGATAAREMTLSLSERAAPAVSQAFVTPDPEALTRLIGYADNPAMTEIYRGFGAASAQGLSDTLIALTAQGKGAGVIASAMSDWLGVPYSWAVNNVRTTQLWSYRTSNHATYAANSDIVDGWVWWADLFGNVCASCVGQHGTLHDVREVLNDHHQGRCTPLPHVVGTRWLEDTQSGQDWFAAQPEARQRQIMGGAMHNAWRSGAVGWQDMSRPYQHAVFGEMLGAPSVRQVLGNRATRYYVPRTGISRAARGATAQASAQGGRTPAITTPQFTTVTVGSGEQGGGVAIPPRERSAG